jgi:serine protease Do
VVSIEAKAKPRAGQSNPQRRGSRQPPQGIPDEMRRFFEERNFDNVPPDGNLGLGSGFIVDRSGVILTNNHVVDGADAAEVTLTDGRKFTSQEIKTDPNTDLAIVRITTDAPLPALRFGDSSQMEIGDRVLAVGAPFGLTGSVTHGIISAKGRDLRLNRYDDFLQTDAPINPGNSGGPLVNLAGEVIGINSAIKSRSGGFQGVGLAIASNLARDIVQQLQKDGSVRRGYLGISMAQEVSPEVAERLGMKAGQGVVVSDVTDKAPAAKAGLQPDDVITSVNGQPVSDNHGLIRIVGSLPIGKAVEVSILRDGKPQKLSLTLEQAPKNYGDPQQRPSAIQFGRGLETLRVAKFGLELADLTAERAKEFGLNGDAALVARVEQGGPAAEAGVVRGLAITKVERKDVRSAEEARDALEHADPQKGALVHVRSLNTGATAILLLKPAAQ